MPLVGELKWAPTFVMTNSGEIAARILSELEEAHEEDVTTLVNTVITVFGELQELKAFAAALLSTARSIGLRQN